MAKSMFGTADRQTENWKGRFGMAERKYTVPECSVTRFTAERTFASTSCQTDVSGSYTSSYTVNCVANGSETIFTDSTYGCTMIVNTSSSSTTWYFTEYNGIKYFCWYDSSVTGAPSNTDILEAIFGSDYMGWHAGTYSENFVNLFTNSY